MISFNREIKISMSINEALSDRRGFLFHVSAGFGSVDQKIDKESGMLVSLVDVDMWLSDLRKKLEARPFPASRWKTEDTYAELLKKARLFLQEKAQTSGAELTSLHFREDRGWGFYWESDLDDRCLRIYQSQFIELFDSQLGPRLCRAEFHWARVSDCSQDLHRESIGLLKKLSLKSYQDILNRLDSIRKYELQSGTVLSSVKLVNSRDNETLEF